MLLRLKRWILCFVLIAACLAVWGMPKFWSAPRPAGVPYGVVFLPHSDLFGTQDFAYHINYFHQIRDGSVGHPYRLEDQERMVRAWLPRASMGLVHAYSPVAFLLVLPLLAIPVEWGFDLVTSLNAVLLVALTYIYLLPRLKSAVQGCAVLASFCSYALFDAFNMGQTAIATTCILAAGYVLLQQRDPSDASPWRCDLLLGALLFVLSAKPSLAVILAALLLGERAWRALLIAGIGLVLTWAWLGPLYGGYWGGLHDYAWLLNHYCQADMTPFMQPGLTPAISTSLNAYLTVLWPADGAGIFQAERSLFEALIVLLVVARWRQWIGLPTQFRCLLWTFLLLSPFLLVTEDLMICLLVVEGDFFRAGALAPIKIALVFLMMNLCMGTWTQLPLFFPIKLALAGWWLLDQLVLPRFSRKAAPQDEERENLAGETS